MEDEGNDYSSGKAPPGSWSLHETILKIVQDAQAAGSVIQIITIWPPASTDGQTPPEMPADCGPTAEPDCGPIAKPECGPIALEDTKPPKPPKK